MAPSPISWRRSASPLAIRSFPASRPTWSRATRCSWPRRRSAIVIVDNIELKPGGGGKIARSAGAYAQLVGRDSGWADCSSELGRDASQSRRMHGLGRRRLQPGPHQRSDGQGRSHALKGTGPTVRSVMMNPVHHPNGGRTKGGKHWATPWGKPTKGYKTRKRKTTDRFIVRSRHVTEGLRITHVTFSLERPVCSTAICSRRPRRSRRWPQRSHQDLEPSLDGAAAVRRPHFRCPQRPQARSGQRHRKT